MASKPCFLNLPCELRDNIYEHYVLEADGYHFDYESGKVRTSGNQPIDLSLMYTCTTVAAELRDLPLKYNKVNFRTVSSDEERLKAGRFDRLRDAIETAQFQALDALNDHHGTFSSYLTPQIEAEITSKYPQFTSFFRSMNRWRRGGMYTYDDTQCNWGEAGSVFREFVSYTIERLSAGTDFLEKLATTKNMFRLQQALYRSPLIFSSPAPWVIPSDETVAEMEKIITADSKEDEIWQYIRWRFSAAAAATHFVQSLPRSRRLNLTNIVLHEDYGTVANPECHVLGLVPFCIENPRLHIERRVNVWRTVLPNGMGQLLHHVVRDLREGLRTRSRILLEPDGISGSFGRWITEALALPKAGMPTGSFRLVFDGEPVPDRSSEVFDRVKCDAAWQAAQDQWCLEQSGRLDFWERRYKGVHFFEGMWKIINDIIEGKSTIQCNFPTGSMYDARPIFERNRGLATSFDWSLAHCEVLDAYGRIQTSPPLPLWVDLLFEHVLPDCPNPI